MRELRLLVLMLLISSVLSAQTRQLSGLLKDSKTGAGIPSATLKVKGKNFSAVTDANGSFTMTVPDGAFQLDISSVGYTTKTVSVDANENSLMLSLDQGDGNLDEVVVTALGIVKEARKVGYAVTTVKNEALSVARETNIGNALAGRVSGLKVSSTSSGPGGTSKLLLRGLPSMTGSGSPLIVINGIPMQNSQRGAAGEWGGADNGDGLGNLNPDDIESMTVLKGQSASALYGNRATNGVIVITTKSAKKGDYNIDYNLNYMSDRALDFTDWQYEYGQGVGGQKPNSAAAAQTNARLSWGARLDGSPITQFDGNSYPYSAVKGNINNFYRNGPSMTNTIAFARGGEMGNFRISLSNLDSKSILPNSGMKRNTVNMNFMQKITDKLSISMIANYIDERSQNRPYLSDGPLNANNGFFLANNMDIRWLAPGFDPETGNEVVFSDDIYVTNPYFVVNQFKNDLGRRRMIVTPSVRYDILKWLYVQGRVGYDNSDDNSFSVTPWGTAYSQDRRGGLNGIGKTQITEINYEGLIGGNRNLTDAIGLDFTVGANKRINRIESMSIGGGPFIIPYQYTFNNVVNFNRGYGFEKQQVNSAFYSLDFTYNNLLTLSTTGRYDAYSTFPADVAGIFTPSVSASFMFHDLLNSSALNYGKFRASYAQTSGEPMRIYSTSLYYGLGNTYNGLPVGSYNQSLPNGLLRPFAVSEFEVGFDLRFFNNRLNLDFAAYTRETKDEIMPASYSIASGFTSGFVGTGSTQNKGVELQLTAIPIQTKNFSWTSSINFTYVKNKILATNPNGTNLNLGTNRAVIGNAVTAYAVGYAGPQIFAFDYKYDSKGDVLVDASGLPLRGNLIPMGSTLPTTYGGWNNEFNYKRFTFSFLIDFNYGNHILSATQHYAMTRGLHKMTLEGRETGITTGFLENGQQNTVAADAQNYYTELARRITKTNVLDGDFVKLRQINLAYNFPDNLFNKVPLFRGATISLVGRNLFYLMKKSDNIDPEASFGANINYLGIEGTSLPTARTLGFNLNLRFKNGSKN
jgi:TonB-linked SusC/RagA family outer membrane protein